MKHSLIALILALAPAMHAGEFHVSPTGSDANPGTEQKPFATLEKARDTARGEKGSKVVLAPGFHRRTKTFELDARDSGTVFSGKGPSIVGSVAIPNSAVKMVTDAAILQRLLPEVRGKVLEVNLRPLGVTDFGEIGPRGFRRPYVPAPLELIVDGKALDVARWPDAGQPGEPMGKVLDKGPVTRNGAKPTRGGIFEFKTDRPARWTQADDVWITGFFQNAYADNTVKVKEFDLEKRTLTTVHSHMYGFTSGHSWNRWETSLNLLEEISVPGEYMADRKTGKLYFLPPAGFDAAKAELEVTMMKEVLVAIEGATGTVFNGVDFRNSRGMGIYIERGADCRIQNATLCNLGMLAISIGKGIAPDPDYRHAFTGKPVSRELGSWHEHIYDNTTFNREAGTGHGIVNCTIYDIGAGAISLGGGDRKSLTPAGNFVENCDIHHFNRWDRTYKAGVNIDGVGNIIRHCKIHDCPGSAIYLHGNEHRIERNEVSNALMEGEEMGAFYMGRDPSERGTVLLNNFFHHIGAWDRPALTGHGSVALHFDDCSGNGTTVHGNIFWRPGSCGAMILGDEITVTNNIFVDCHSIQDVFAFGDYTRLFKGIFTARLNAVGFDKAPWTQRYPGFEAYLKNLPTHKRESLFRGNLLVNCPLWVRAIKSKAPDCVKREDNREITTEEAASLFVDAPRGNFVPKPGTDLGIPAFKPIPFDTIAGLDGKPVGKPE